MRSEARILSGGVRGSTVFSSDWVYQYALGRAWDSALPPAVFVTLSPSIATVGEDDLTVHRCGLLARSWGCGGILMVYLYAVRTVAPYELYTLADPVGPENLMFVRHTIMQHNPAFVVCAWGDSRLAAKQSPSFMATMADRPLSCLGRNSDGSPVEPLASHVMLTQFP